MTFQATVYQVMIASPSDIEGEREIIREVIHEWNSINAHFKNMILLPVGWETDASPIMGVSGQEVINKQLLEESDILVAVFWTRIGTPTIIEKSGTVEEITKHHALGKPTLIYFSKTPVRPDSVDPDQYEELKTFREWCESNGLIHEYTDLEEFRKLFNRHLSQTLNRYVSPESGEIISPNKVNDRTEPKTQMYPIKLDETLVDIKRRKGDPGLSNAAKSLLLEASLDSNGIVLMVKSMDGLSISTNGKDFINDSNPRTKATWEGAVSELTSFGYLKPEGHKGEVFGVTSSGYERADWIRSNS